MDLNVRSDIRGLDVDLIARSHHPPCLGTEHGRGDVERVRLLVQLENVRVRTDDQGLTLVHFSAQPEPFSSQLLG